jgi:lysine 6-dehydrogenase
MTRIAVVGVGHMGQAALKFLRSARPELEYLALDMSADAVARVVDMGGSIEGCVADVSREQPDLSGVDIVLNLAGPFFAGSDHVARAAIAAGATYLDIADDVEATERILALDAEARSAGVALVTGAGLSPGVSNWMAVKLIDEHPETDGIHVAWVTHESDPGGLAPVRHMLHMTVNPCPVFVEGRWEKSPGFRPETAQSFDFPAPLGRTDTFDTSHPEPVTLVRQFPQLRYARCQGALMPAWANSAFATLGRIGFGYSELEVEVDGVTIEPAEVLWRLMWARYNSRTRGARTATTSVLVEARKADQVLGAVAIIDDGDMARGTGLGAAAAVLSVLDRAPSPGAAGPEVLPWRVALEYFQELATAHGGYADGLQRVGPGIPATASQPVA